MASFFWFALYLLGGVTCLCVAAFLVVTTVLCVRAMWCVPLSPGRARFLRVAPVEDRRN